VSVTLKLNPQVEENLKILAHSRGMSLSEYLQEIAVREASRQTSSAESNGEERARAFLEWAESFPDTPPLSDEAISRTGLYPDR